MWDIVSNFEYFMACQLNIIHSVNDDFGSQHESTLARTHTHTHIHLNTQTSNYREKARENRTAFVNEIKRIWVEHFILRF